MEKGIEISANMLATIILLIVAVVIVLGLWATLVENTGGPVSNVFYKLFDWIAGIFG